MDDFLFRIFFAKNFFSEIQDLTGEKFSEDKKWRGERSGQGGRRRRGERGRDREKRQQRPWSVEERVHLRILELLGEGRGKVWIARELGVGVQTVQRRAAVQRREGDEPGTVDFRTVRGEACEKHGAVTVWPCVQCLAEEERARVRSMN